MPSLSKPMSTPATYTLWIRNDKKKLYQRMGILLSLINFFGLLVAWNRQASLYGLQMITYVAVPLYALYTIYRFRQGFGKNRWGIIEYLIAVGWVFSPYPWLALVFAALTFLYEYASGDLPVKFEAEGIQYGNIFSRTIPWEEMSNVVLKDGLLTLDFKSNKLFQQYLSPQAPVEESAFNRFCQERLTAHP